MYRDMPSGSISFLGSGWRWLRFGTRGLYQTWGYWDSEETRLYTNQYHAHCCSEKDIWL